MADLIYPDGAGITVVSETELEADDMTFVGCSLTGTPQQTDYSNLRAGLLGAVTSDILPNPGQIGLQTTPVDGIYAAGYINLSSSGTVRGGLSLVCTYKQTAVLSGTSVLMENTAYAPGMLLLTQFRVDVAVTDSGGDDTWSAAYSGGITGTIVTGAAAAQNTKVDAYFDPNAASPVFTSNVNIILTPNGGNFTGGQITAVTYYWKRVSLPNV